MTDLGSVLVTALGVLLLTAAVRSFVARSDDARRRAGRWTARLVLAAVTVFVVYGLLHRR